MADVCCLEVDASAILADLSRGKVGAKTQIHLDPDLQRPSGRHLPGWLPALGQTGAAQGHLRKQQVGAGDVFLFFGWFRQIERYLGAWRYARTAPDLHVMFGWIEVGVVVPIFGRRKAVLADMPWIAGHPHVAGRHYDTDSNNTLYMARDRSRWLSPSLGGGRFKMYDTPLQLTASSSRKSLWSLPAWFFPGPRPPLSYHSDPRRWTRDGDRVRLQSVAKGQEFVLDMAHYPEAEKWLSALIRRHGRN